MKKRFGFRVKNFQGQSAVPWIWAHTYSSPESCARPCCAWFHLPPLQEVGSLEPLEGQWGYSSLSWPVVSLRHTKVFCRTNVGVGVLPKRVRHGGRLSVFLLIQYFLHFLDVLPLCLTPYCYRPNSREFVPFTFPTQRAESHRKPKLSFLSPGAQRTFLHMWHVRWSTHPAAAPSTDGIWGPTEIEKCVLFAVTVPEKHQETDKAKAAEG